MEKHPDIFVVRRIKDETKVEPMPVGYFEYFFTSVDFFVLIPFRIRRSNKSIITCEKNVIHQIVCAAILFSTLICNIPVFLESLTVNIYADPIRLFDQEICLVQLLYSFVFYSVCWRKTERIMYFANLSSSNFLCGSKRKLVYAFISIYPVLLDTLMMDHFQDYVAFAVRSTAQGEWYRYVYRVITVVGYFGSIMLTNFLDMYIAVVTLSGYNIMRNSIVSIEELKKLDVAQMQWKQGDFSCLIEVAEKLQHFFATLNSIGSSIILTWFCMLVPWVSHKLVDSLPGTGADLVAVSFRVPDHKIRRKCDNLKREMKTIILQYDPKLFNGIAAFVHLEHALENVGIQGGFFFNLSYSFLGSAVGLIVAYAFLALQLRLNCYVLMIDEILDYVSFADKNEWHQYINEVVKLVGFLGSILLSNFIDTYITVVALSGYNIMRKSIVSIEQLMKCDVAQKKWKHGDFSCLIEIAEKLQHFFATLNSIGSSIILIWFCMCAPWVSNKLPDSLPGTMIDVVADSVLTLLTKVDKHIIGQIYYWSFIGLYLGFLVLCAEIRRECSNIKREMKRIILQYDPKLKTGEAALVHIEHALENVGIHGGFFFSLSYSFLGSTAGLVVAYVFLALQLRLNCCILTSVKTEEQLNV
ncbi:unnamed protein product [Orchesella dallaii]|uniref:Gustatory receptor n=1 Tax=Orchesella dallaii TaxID=48710 RepID=A0ABP1QGP8_9HEXA